PRAEAFREQVRVAERGLAVVRERLAAMAEQRTTAQAELIRLRGTLERLANDEQEAALVTPEGGDAFESDDDERLRALQAHLAEEVRAQEVAQSERASRVSEIARTDASMRDAESRLARTTQHVHSLQSNVAVDEARQTDRETRLASVQEQLEAVSQ